MIADFHNDFLTSEGGGDLAKIARETECCVCAVYTGGRGIAEVRRIVGRFRQKREKNLYLSLEDASYLDESTAEEVCGWEPVCVSLTSNGSNVLAGGCLSDGGLTARGRKAVRALCERGIAVDCAHLNARSFYDVSEETPLIVNSHTCFNGVCRHPRNIDDWQIRAVCERGGLIGIAFVGKFLSDAPASAQDVFRHVDYAVQKFGDGHFCFGSDFCGTDDLPRGLANYAEAENLRDLFFKAGYPQASVNKIFAENLRRFLAKKI